MQYVRGVGDVVHVHIKVDWGRGGKQWSSAAFKFPEGASGTARTFVLVQGGVLPRGVRRRLGRVHHKVSL
jgi:hypothetical protein